MDKSSWKISLDLWLAFLITAIFLSPTAPVAASELLDGFVVNVDQAGKVITIRDSETGQNRLVSVDSSKDMAFMSPGSHIRLWISKQDNGLLKAERICGRQRYDKTGIKKRLRKAIGSRGMGFHGHRGRGHGR